MYFSDVWKEKVWKKEDELWQANVVERGNIGDDSIVDGTECCRMCRERYPDTKAWEKFINYKECKCFHYPDHFSPVNGYFSSDHGAYTIGICE